MATVLFSKLAENDLQDIAAYTLETWGVAQAARYLESLQTTSEQAADQPSIGRSCEQIRPGLRRIAAGSHVIFYRIHAEGITLSRILHQRMLPDRHAMEE